MLTPVPQWWDPQPLQVPVIFPNLYSHLLSPIFSSVQLAEWRDQTKELMLAYSVSNGGGAAPRGIWKVESSFLGGHGD